MRNRLLFAYNLYSYASSNQFMEAGSYKEARNRGTTRLEGKTYPVQDGDIIEFRFNV